MSEEAKQQQLKGFDDYLKDLDAFDAAVLSLQTRLDQDTGKSERLGDVNMTVYLYLTRD